MQKKQSNYLISFLLLVWFSVLYCVGSGVYFIPIGVVPLMVVGIPLIIIYHAISPVYLFKTDRYRLLLLVFSALLFAGSLYTKAPKYGMFKAVTLSAYLLIFFLVSKSVVKNTRLFMKIGIIIGIGFLVVIILKFKDPLSYLETMNQQEVRLGEGINDGENLNPIWLARYMGFMIITAFFYLKGVNKRQWLFKYLYIAIGGIYLIATASKGPLISLVIAICVCFLEFKNKGKFWLRMFLFLIAGISLSFFLDFSNNKFLSRRFSVENNDAVIERFLFIHKVLGDFSQTQLLTGAGTGNAGFVIKGDDERGYPHNIVLEVVYENGVFALLILIYFYYEGYKGIKYRNLSPTYRYWLCLFIFYSLNALVSGDLPSNQFLFFSFLCLQASKPDVYKYAKFRGRKEINPGLVGKN